MNRLTSISRGLLLGTMAALVLLKLPVLLGDWPVTFYVGLVLELAIVGLLLGRRWKVGAWLALGFAGGALVYHYLYPATNCGCMGMAEDMFGNPEVLVASIMGLLAGVSLVDMSRAGSGAPEEVAGSEA